MSWEAVTWATKQRMKTSHEQLVLLVLANAADPDGVAFARWPGRDHWWKYLVDLTRLSKSTLFRDINTLIEVGLCARSMIVMSDGARRPTITLDLSANYKFDKEQFSHSHTETGGEDDFGDGENVHDINDKQEDISGGETHSHTETVPAGGNGTSPLIPTGGTEPFPVAGMHKEDSNTCSKESPPTPQRGASPDDGFEDFKKGWAEPVPKMSLAHSAWNSIPTVKRGEALTAARGYVAHFGAQVAKALASRLQPPTRISAQSFLRDSAGWAQWLPYADVAGSPTALTGVHPCDSIEAKALAVLFDIAGKGDFFRQVHRSAAAVSYPKPVTPQLAALAQARQQSEWVELTHQQAGAWESILREFVTVQARHRLREGSRAPWTWPPRKDGTLSSTGPPEGLMTEQDYADFK